ncbi:hypothetical protein HPB47_002223 [Ixodes persulcatus]|uniref:Uncharacterized protein n=1 Tax=Ixodes persulcatus TaxID=34615 RepID=A0AC60PMQ9_IXOPE|nr:hypothetical protein HPB47_002223 [Ixodes persulcatus]
MSSFDFKKRRHATSNDAHSIAALTSTNAESPRSVIREIVREEFASITASSQAKPTESSSLKQIIQAEVVAAMQPLPPPRPTHIDTTRALQHFLLPPLNSHLNGAITDRPLLLTTAQSATTAASPGTAGTQRSLHLIALGSSPHFSFKSIASLTVPGIGRASPAEHVTTHYS